MSIPNVFIASNRPTDARRGVTTTSQNDRKIAEKGVACWRTERTDDGPRMTVCLTGKLHTRRKIVLTDDQRRRKIFVGTFRCVSVCLSLCLAVVVCADLSVVDFCRVLAPCCCGRCCRCCGCCSCCACFLCLCLFALFVCFFVVVAVCCVVVVETCCSRCFLFVLLVVQLAYTVVFSLYIARCGVCLCVCV